MRSIDSVLQHFVSNNCNELNKADKLIFPGVGEARSAMDALIRTGLADWLKEVTVPFLGICLGMQLLLNIRQNAQPNVWVLFPVQTSGSIAGNLN